MRYALFILLFGPAMIAAGQQVPQPQYCQNVSAGIEHGGALEQFCEFAVTLQEKLPNFICEETMKSEFSGAAKIRDSTGARVSPGLTVVTAQVRHEDGRDSYSRITLNGEPFTSSMSELPGSWSEGEFGSLLPVIFAPESHAAIQFLKETKWHATPALLFGFRVARENNQRWFLQVGQQVARPGVSGQFWLDASSHAVLRLEMVAEDLAHSTPPGRPPFPLKAVRKSIEYANVHLADGSEFVLPSTSDERKCLLRDTCFHEQLTFQNCHKFTVKSRILEDVTQ